MPRQGLNKRKVLEAALAVVDAGGIEELTMRRLGQELGVEAPSLYKHTGGKPDILDGIVELVYEEIDFGEASGAFRERVRSYSNAFRRALLRHPNVLPLIAMRPVTGEGTIALVETALDEMRRLGFPPSEGRKYLNVAVSFIVGHALAEVGARQASLADVIAARQELDHARFPNVMRTLASDPVDHDAEFALGIEMIVDGIEQMAAAALSA